MLLHEPGRYPVAYFPARRHRRRRAGTEERATRHQDLGNVLVHRPGRRAQQAAGGLAAHRNLPGYASELRGRVAFAWRAMDAFYEEEERIVGHAADSYHRIDIRQTSRHLLGRHQDRVDRRHHLAAGPVRVRVRAPLVRPARRRRRNRAHRGGRSDVLPVQGPGQLLRHRDAHRAAWSYEDAWTEVRRISGLISFEPDKIEVHLDGTRLRPEPGQTVIPHGPDRDLTTGEVAPGRQP